MRKGGKGVEEYKKYDVVYGKFTDANGESIQAGYRPAIVIQNDIGNKFSPTLLVIPLSSQLKKLDMPTHTVIKNDSKNGLRKDSVLLAEQATTISKKKVKKIGSIEDRSLQKKIFKCFIFSAAFGDQDEDFQELQIM